MLRRKEDEGEKGKRTKIPVHVKDVIPSLRIRKGSINNVPITMWSVIPFCNPDRCPVRVHCPSPNVEKQCSVRAGYVQSTFAALVGSLGKNLTEELMQRIGLHLVPLYAHLVQFKMVELSLANPMVFDDKGGVKMHPVYREIRQTIDSIERVWCAVKKDGFADKDVDRMKKAMDVDSFLHGDLDFADNLMEGEAFEDARKDEEQ